MLPFDVGDVEVYREDLLVDAGGTAHLVLDFGREERQTTTVDPETFDSTTSWVATERIAIRMQAIDPDTREGLSHPTHRYIEERPIVQVRRGVDFGPGPWSGWTLQAISPRRS